MNKISVFFINNPLIVNVLTVFILVSGFVMYQTMQKEGYPPVEEPGCSISAVYQGATPSDVELNVAMKIEEKLEGISGIKNYSSSSYENYCSVTVFFENDADYEQIREDIRNELDSIPDFPEEMTERPRIHEWGAKYMDLMQIGIYSKSVSYSDLKERYDELKERIESLPDIAEIEAWGSREREIHIRIDLDKLNSYYITFNEIIRAIQSNNIQVSGGSIKSNNTEKNIVTLSKFTKPFDISKVIIRSNIEGNSVRLSDVAVIEDTFSEMDSVIRFNGHEGFAMAVYKKESSDIITSVEEVNRIIEEYQEEIGTDEIGIAVLVDNSEHTKFRLKVVQNNALTGLFLVSAMLFIFLNFKNAMWTVLGIPFSVCFGLLILSGMGITINSVTLLAIIIVLGMIVDDAIVIAENVHRHRIIDGTTPDITNRAVMEVGFAVLTTILTTLVAFIPLYFMEGVIGAYVKEVPIVISLLLIGSLIESVLILPSHLTHNLTVLQRTVLGAVIGALAAYFIASYLNFNQIIAVLITIAGSVGFSILFFLFYKEDTRLKERSYVIMMRSVYGKILNIILKLRYAALFLLLLILGTGVYLASTMRFEMFPAIEANRLNISGDLIGNNPLEYTSDKLAEIEKFIQETYDKDTVDSYVSINGTSSNPEHFQLIIFMTPESTREIKTDTIIDSLREKFSEEIYENMNYGTSDGGPDLGNNVVIEISGNNDTSRTEVADLIENELKTMDGAKEINRNDADTKKQLHIVPNYEEMAKNSVNAAQLAKLTRIAFEGFIVTHLRSPEGDIPYRIILDEKYRNKLETFDSLLIPTSTRNLATISSMIDINEAEAVTRIKRFNGKRTATISAEFDSEKKTASEIYQDLSEKYKNIPKLYPGINVYLGGAAEISNEALGSLQSTLIVAISGIFVLLVLLFRSITQPFIVIVAIPFGLIGVIFAFFMHNMPLSFMGIMGAIGLSGVVVNDSLVMVNYINQLKVKHKDKKLREIVVEGAKTRLRPIILTTVTTFAGLLPSAYGIGGKDAFIVPTAISLSWGLFFSTTLILLFLPSFYLIEQDISNIWKTITGAK
jgi:multidrug efflux pump subunit AcrB